MKLKKVVGSLLIMTLTFAMMSSSFASVGNSKIKSTTSISIEANDEQIKKLNTMDLENMSPYEIMQIVFPEEASKISDDQIDFLNKSPMESNTKSAQMFMTRGNNATSYIGNYRDRIKFYSKNNYPSPKQFVTSSLYDIGDDRYDERDDELIAYKFAYDEIELKPGEDELDPTNYDPNRLIGSIKASGTASPPTGDYYVKGQHSWLYIATGANTWSEMNLTSKTGVFHHEY